LILIPETEPIGLAPGRSPSLSILTTGVSDSTVCGVRDYARVLERAFVALDSTVETEWWDRDPSAGWTSTVRAATRWSSTLMTRIERARPDVVLWHYSVFTYGRQGIPLLVPIVCDRLAQSAAPVVCLLHEFVYDHRPLSARGVIWGSMTRAALVPVVLASAALIVTTTERARWLCTRRWLPDRPVAFAPVSSNLPIHRTAQARETGAVSVGVFSFGAQDVEARCVVEAICALRDRGFDVRLVLVGAPGPESGQAAAWRRLLSSGGHEGALAFTGVLDPDALADSVQALDLLVHPYVEGPSSRRTTLAAALAHGIAVVALDGPHTWSLLVREGAVALTPPESSGLAAELERLVRDAPARKRQGARGLDFYRRFMEPVVVATRLVDLLASVAKRR
jgi:glycosyltransferase involved in cell wall biosynthesis